MRPHARHALRTTRPCATRALSQPLPGLLKRRPGIQVGSQCASGRIHGVRCGAACGEESRGLAHVCVGRRGVAPVRRYVVRAPYLVSAVLLYADASLLKIELLRSCPRLKFISTSLGSILPPPNSHVRRAALSSPKRARTLIAPHVQLFDFSDLYGFSLTFKTGFYWQNDGVHRPQLHPRSRILLTCNFF